MKKRILLTTLILFVLLFVNITVPTTVVGQGTDPYDIYGTVYDEDGETVVSGATITIENLDTGEKNTVGDDTTTTDHTAIVVTTDSSGDYQFNLASLKSGYSIGHKIKVTATKTGEPDGSKTHTISTSTWGARVDVTLGEVEEDEDTWWDWLWGLLMSLCSWWGILVLILIGVICYILFGKSSKRTGTRSKK